MLGVDELSATFGPNCQARPSTDDLVLTITRRVDSTIRQVPSTVTLSKVAKVSTVCNTWCRTRRVLASARLRAISVQVTVL